MATIYKVEVVTLEVILKKNLKNTYRSNKENRTGKGNYK
jgi:hypothetical protein